MDLDHAPPSATSRIGWQSPKPPPEGYRFNPFLRVAGGRLQAHGLDLAAFFEPGRSPAAGLPMGEMPSPLEIAFLPNIRAQVEAMDRCFRRRARDLGYPAPFHFAFASKANTAEEIVRSTLTAGAHHEMSSDVDVEIARRMIRANLLPADRIVLANGFKGPGSAYARNLVALRREGGRVIPILEDAAELDALAGHGVDFEFGVRLSRPRADAGASDWLADRTADRDSRFGVDVEEAVRLADRVDETPGARFVLLHAMFGSANSTEQTFVDALAPGLDLYARLSLRHPHLRFFDFGGGVPGRTTLDHDFDYDRFARLLLEKALAVCGRHGASPPALIGEFGRYTVSEHAAHLFRVIAAKPNGAGIPWYLVNGSIMTSFPDTWALGEHFICLPLGHLDRPFHRVRLGGITCDRDDVYPPRGSAVPLFLPDLSPAELDRTPLHVGFFSVGAYQEMLGGVRGSKHCVLPEATELLIDDDRDGGFRCDVLPGHTTEDVLHNLGYGRTARLGAASDRGAGAAWLMGRRADRLTG